MKLTIGLTSFMNFHETWFTIQALRMYHDLRDCEILVIDNFGDEHLKNFITAWCADIVRYVEYKEAVGPANAKNQIFIEAKGDWVLAIDSHVMLEANAIANLKAWLDANEQCNDLLHGPLIYDNLRSKADAMNDEWRGGMWGTWRNPPTMPGDAFEIPMHGMGLFCCRKGAWLGFNDRFRGFGGEEGYIHAKFRQAGRKVLCLPFLGWVHHFRTGATPYPMNYGDRIKNYCTGFQELGLDLTPIIEHFGQDAVNVALKEA